MPRTVCSKTALAALALSLASGLSAYQDPPVVFKSDVSLVRVDVQVLSATGQVIGKLQREDFELRESGQVRPEPPAAHNLDRKTRLPKL